jgi:hypothetical protein
MISIPAEAMNIIPIEYREVLQKLFPQSYSTPRGAHVFEEFTAALGVYTPYQKALAALSQQALDESCAVKLRGFLNHFEHNLDLLISKTWVEKDDEIRKERLQEQIEPFIDTIEKGNYTRALKEFSVILEELAWLFFGAQSQKEDFIEYTLRIDTQLGLFWWYASRIGQIEETVSQSELASMLLIGICYLTDF